jgi:hypothetical protein
VQYVTTRRKYIIYFGRHLTCLVACTLTCGSGLAAMDFPLATIWNTAARDDGRLRLVSAARSRPGKGRRPLRQQGAAISARPTYRKAGLKHESTYGETAMSRGRW